MTADMTRIVEGEEADVVVATSEAGPSALLDGESVIMALDLLAHWWSRPTSEEVAVWLGAVESEQYVASKMAVGPWFPSQDIDDVESMLDEYERLFVGPGPVPCPPYESYWRNDVSVDIRRSLMGPCTADLVRLYREIGLEVAPHTGELPDQIAIELEALAFSLSIEDAAAVSRAVFIDHLGKWFAQLCRAVTHAAELPFYKTLANLTLGWLGPIKAYFQSMAISDRAAG
jgi:TorA maturation chaperone TorD